MRVRVKIEGLRDVATAQAIAALGADAIGLVLAPSPRRVSIAQAAAIAQALPPWVSSVGVFVNAPLPEVNAAAADIGLDYVQLHGDETPEFASAVAARVIKAFRIRDERWADEVSKWVGGYSGQNLRAVLLDAYDPAARGGTGRRFNWQWISDARAAGLLASLPPIILAGGLDPACVADAIKHVQPWGVDVASGVESAPGVKDMDKVKAFITAAGV